jgi:hypothetical protein
MSDIKFIASLYQVVFDRIPTHLRYIGWWRSEWISVQSPNVPPHDKLAENPLRDRSYAEFRCTSGILPARSFLWEGRWSQFRARKEELVLTAWRGFWVHEDEQNSGYFRRFQGHDLRVRWIYGFRGEEKEEFGDYGWHFESWPTLLTHSPRSRSSSLPMGGVELFECSNFDTTRISISVGISR